MRTARAGFAALSFALLASTASAAEPIDLSKAVIVFGPKFGPNQGPEALLTVELHRRANLFWPSREDWEPGSGRPAVLIGVKSDDLGWARPFTERLKDGKGVDGPEGYRILTDPKAPAVLILGNDARGALFGAGRLLREMTLSRGKATLPADFGAATAPKVALRGHQLGYRPKTNSYDGWDRTQWFRYIAELACYGTNAIELLPPRTDDALDSPHFPLPPIEMMEQMSLICSILGLDVWVWLPVLDDVEHDPAKAEATLKEWDEVLRKLPRVDAVFVPGGDPGHTPPKTLFAFLERGTEVLHRKHPKATMWVSPQGFDAEWYDAFVGLMRQNPNWLTGVVHGPQVRVPLERLRSDVPASYPIRNYPDITHNRQCQFPVPDWDQAFALTEGREAINPRPRAQAALLRAAIPTTVGFLTYSEGCNDDVNKVVWSALGWDPDADVAAVLRDYARYLVTPENPDGFARALLGLEQNWSGSLLANPSVETTLAQLQDLERTATPKVRQNWRFQQALYRAYYDAWLRDRLRVETAAQADAMDALRDADRVGSELALKRAEDALDRGATAAVSPTRRTRIFSLAEALFQSIQMQLSVEKYLAIDAERGANLDTIDAPLNDRVWLQSRFAAIRSLTAEPDRLKAIDGLLHRTDPGPGGFYDDLGDPSSQPHLVTGYETDPLLARAGFNGFALRPDWPAAWRDVAQTYFDAPLKLRYDGLDPKARYRVRVTYAGDSPKARMRLEADGIEVHPRIAKPDPVEPLEFLVPAAATADGRLELSWTQQPGRGGNGRGCQVAEVWLIRAGEKGELNRR